MNTILFFFVLSSVMLCFVVVSVVFCYWLLGRNAPLVPPDRRMFRSRIDMLVGTDNPEARLMCCERSGDKTCLMPSSAS